MIDYINTRRAEGEDRLTAILAAGPIRLRPVLMTTLTTVLGLLPMAMGMSEGSEIIAPLAIVIIGGLIMGTVLTLVLIPVVYSLIDDLTPVSYTHLISVPKHLADDDGRHFFKAEGFGHNDVHDPADAFF